MLINAVLLCFRLLFVSPKNFYRQGTFINRRLLALKMCLFCCLTFQAASYVSYSLSLMLLPHELYGIQCW